MDPEPPHREPSTLHLSHDSALNPPLHDSSRSTPARPANGHDGLKDYQLDEVLGRGGMGVVYRAFDAHLQRTVALKMMNMTGVVEAKELAASAQRFEQEAYVTGKLQHPGVVPVYLLDRTATGTPFYTMRPIEGRSLRDILDALRADDTASVAEFPLIRLIRVLAEACRAVAYAHDERVIHRDLKPGNIMVGKYGEVLVIDWGLAKCLDGVGPESIDGSTVSAPGEVTPVRETPPLRPDDSNDGYIIGTPAFMPPEQTFGAEHITTRSDVYCLGTILYQILTLTPPFDPELSLEQLLDAIRYEAVQPPVQRAPERNPDPELSRIAMRCLNKLPQDRPATAAAVVQDLDHWLEGRPQFELVYECAEFTERELRTRWYVSRGEWECIDGSLQPLRTDGNSSHCLLMFREPLPGDLRITVRGTILDDPAKLVGAGGHIGLVTHSPNFRGYASYLIDGYVAEAPCLVEGQTAVKLARNDVDIAYGDWPFTREQTGFEVCLEVLNAHYTLTINGKEVISHTEFVQLPGEFVGLFTYGPAVLIHAVKIESAGM
ncbi:MAG TPA: protein kinase, partial [Planctomycetota bacterium]|nr:protein kinase [Planctomycetota bacterium]